MIQYPAVGASCSSFFFPSAFTTNQKLSQCGSTRVLQTSTKPKKIVGPNRWPAPQVRVRVRAQSDVETKVGVSSNNDKNVGGGDVPTSPFRGRFLEGFRVFRQNYLVSCFQVGEYGKAKPGYIMNVLQDTPMNRSWAVQDVSLGEFGATSEMMKKDLTWVAYRIRFVLDRYPLWGDIIEVDNYMTCPSGSSTIRSDCIIRNEKTREPLVRATSQVILMNKKTRRLSKVTQEMRDEVEEYHHQVDPIIDEQIVRLPPFDVNSAQYVQSGIVPKYDDIDVNGHVNSSNYIDWIIQSTPRSILESHEIADVIMEFQKECGTDAVVQSLTSFLGTTSNEDIVELDHLLRLESGPKLIRGRTVWRPKQKHYASNFRFMSA